MAYIFGTMPHIFGTMPHIFGTMPKTMSKNNTDSGLLADQGEARGCSTNSLALRRRHAQTVRDGTSSYKIDYVIMIKNFLNPKEHQNPFRVSKVTAILLKGWICPMGGVA